MKFAVVVIALAAATSVFAQNQNQNGLPFPFNIIQVPQIVPAPFCLCGVLPRLKLLEKDECMKDTFRDNFVQPIQDEMCQPQQPSQPPMFTPPNFNIPNCPPWIFPSPPPPQPNPPPCNQCNPCKQCNRPTCTCNHYC